MMMAAIEINKKSEIEIANEKAERIMNAVARMTAYYRANMHRFIEEYLGIKLRLFQKILIYMMSTCTNGMVTAARGIGKSFLIAVFAVARAILYPGTEIVVVSKTRKQAIGILQKITEIFQSPDCISISHR